jgi:hypothetical protein
VVVQEKSGHWTFETDVKFPSKTDVFAPDKTLLLTFEFPAMEHAADYALPEITIKNSSDRPVSLTYKIFGYDEKRRSMSEGDDTAVIGAGESAVRQMIASPNALNLRNAASFRLVGEIPR